MNTSEVSTSVRTQLTPTLFNGLRNDAARQIALAGASKTVASGAITVVPSAGEGYYTVDTQSSASADDLDTINGGAAGDVINLILVAEARVVTLKHGTGNISLPGASDLALTADMAISLRYSGSVWLIVGGAGGGGVFASTNKSGIDLSKGFVVVNNSAYDQAVKTTTLIANPSTVGVALSATANNAKGNFASSGLQTVAVTGTVVRGHWLVSSGTAGYAKDSGFVSRPMSGGIGIAQTANASGLGTVQCLLSVIPTTSQDGVQQLSTQTVADWGGNRNSLTFSHTVDVGTDCLIVSVASQGSLADGRASAVSYNGVALTAYGNAMTNAGSVWTAEQVYYMKNPPAGTANIVITFVGSYYNGALATNWIGTQPTPFRAVQNVALGSGTSISATPASAVGDVIFCSANTENGISTPGAGQTIVYNGNAFVQTSTKPGENSSTTVSYSGGYSGRAAMVAGALAGS